MKFITTLTLLATLATTQGFTAPTPKPCTTSTALQVSRREALSTFGALVVAAPTAANAIAACPPGSNNCVRQTWTPPASISSADAISQLRDAIGSYPQGGQDGGKIDGGGYTLITDNLDASGGLVYEFRSSGKGTFAKLFNGGKPFVDDLIVEPNGSAFEFRSSSRVGDSDFGVNKARLAFIGNLLQEKGWTGA